MPLSFVRALGSRITERDKSLPWILNQPLRCGHFSSKFYFLIEDCGSGAILQHWWERGTSQVAVYGYVSIYDSEVWFDVRNKQGEESKHAYIRPELMLLIMNSWFEICSEVSGNRVQSHWSPCPSSENIKSSSIRTEERWSLEVSKNSFGIIQTMFSFDRVTRQGDWGYREIWRGFSNDGQNPWPCPVNLFSMTSRYRKHTYQVCRWPIASRENPTIIW